MQTCRSDLIEDIDREGILGAKDSVMRQKLDENSESNEIIQNKKSYEFKAPLISEEEIDKIGSPEINYNTNGQRVKFTSGKTLDSEQSEPLINVSDQMNRFKITQVKDTKNLLDTHENETEYLINDKGVLIRKSPSNLSETKRTKKNLLESEDSKPINFKYNKDAKSLEFSINIGNNGNAQEKGCFSQLKFLSFYQALFAEFLGTYLLVLFVIGFGLPISDPKINPPEINGCLGSGLIVASLVWGLGHIGGAHINPAVSLALLATGETNAIRALFYIACQLLGSVLGALTLVELVPGYLYTSPSSKNLIQNSTLLRLKRESNSTKFLEESSITSFPIEYSTLGVTLLNDQITPLQGFFVEVLITFILVFTIFACIDKNRNDLGGSFPLTIGFAVTVGALFGGKFTGGSMNPARSFGPAFISQNWSNHWIYWAGPITGAIFAGFLYKLLSLKQKKKQ